LPGAREEISKKKGLKKHKKRGGNQRVILELKKKKRALQRPEVEKERFSQR